ncbi:MAG TPA: hypothetical protein VHW01_00430, partial [Polyangiaceae bacterium]|nr:hypothetical protein [Polyangiaceae bacterium]
MSLRRDGFQEATPVERFDAWAPKAAQAKREPLQGRATVHEFFMDKVFPSRAHEVLCVPSGLPSTRVLATKRKARNRADASGAWVTLQPARVKICAV